MNSTFFNLLKKRENKEFLAVPNLLSSSRSIMGEGDSTATQSLCVVLRYQTTDSIFCSIVQLDPVAPEMIKNPRKRIYAKCIAHFWRPHDDETLKPEGPEQLPWVFSTPTSSNDDLYLLPDLHFRSPEFHPLYGAAFNCSTNSFQPIKQPHAYKLGGIAVTVRQHVYFMAHPCFYPHLMGTPDVDVFERYNPANQLWEPQVPFPFHDLWRFAFRCKIMAFAVWDDTTILLNIGGCEIWAYHVSYRQWYPVTVKEDKGGGLMCLTTNRCYDIEGEAFVVDNTIYALSRMHFEIVLALSINKKGVGPDLQYSCAFRSELLLDRIELFPGFDGCSRSRYFFPLGKDKLCFVQSCGYDNSVKTQSIHVSYIKRMEHGKMTLKDMYRYWVPLVYRQQFKIGSCFSLPDCKTTALKPCETFIFDPILGTASPGIPVQEKQNVARPKQASGVIVIDLPPDATARQLEKSMKKFGRLKRDKIQLIRDTAGKYHCAFVEFESAAARRRATEASPIRIGGCRSRSEILKLKGTSSLAKVSSNVESSGGSSSKNHKRKR